MYQVYLVWNRCFNLVPFGDLYETIKEAKEFAKVMLNSGDGERVKKCQVIDVNTGEVVVPSHKITS
jgi:hypothetical protein